MQSSTFLTLKNISMKVTPYLNYKGNCEEAFNFYKTIFGGEFNYIGRFKDMPNSDELSTDEANKIMHISLPVGDGFIYGSDILESMSDHFVTGNNITLAITPDSEDEARRLFDALGEGGRVTMPLDKTFWGSLFGMVTDKFGLNWMVDYEIK